MALVSDVTVPGDSFPLGRLLEDLDVLVEIERLVPTGDRLLPYVWVAEDSPEHVETTFGSRSVVASVDHLTGDDGRHLYRVRWTPDVDGFLEALLDTEGAILEGKGVDGAWAFRLRFPDQERLRRFGELCEERGIALELDDVYEPHVPPAEDRLSATHWRTLTAAYRMGFFEVPREATLTDLGERLGVSKQAASGRVRRATKAMVGALLYEPSGAAHD